MAASVLEDGRTIVVGALLEANAAATPREEYDDPAVALAGASSREAAAAAAGLFFE